MHSQFFTQALEALFQKAVEQIVDVALVQNKIVDIIGILPRFSVSEFCDFGLACFFREHLSTRRSSLEKIVLGKRPYLPGQEIQQSKFCFATFVICKIKSISDFIKGA